MLYRVETKQDSGKWIARASQFKSSHQREGDTYEPLAIVLADNEKDALEAVVREAFLDD